MIYMVGNDAKQKTENENDNHQTIQKPKQQRPRKSKNCGWK